MSLANKVIVLGIVKILLASPLGLGGSDLAGPTWKGCGARSYSPLTSSETTGKDEKNKSHSSRLCLNFPRFFQEIGEEHQVGRFMSKLGLV